MYAFLEKRKPTFTRDDSMALDKETRVGVVGAGAMGTGIAQVAAAAGHIVVVLGDVGGWRRDARAQANIGKAMDREVQKERLTRDAADSLIQARIDFQWEPLGDDLSAYKHCGLVIEAVVEDLGMIKQSLFQRFGACGRARCRSGDEHVVAVGRVDCVRLRCIGAREIGIHFFNPAPILPLVEVRSVAWR